MSRLLSSTPRRTRRLLLSRGSGTQTPTGRMRRDVTEILYLFCQSIYILGKSSEDGNPQLGVGVPDIDRTKRCFVNVEWSMCIQQTRIHALRCHTTVSSCVYLSDLLTQLTTRKHAFLKIPNNMLPVSLDPNLWHLSWSYRMHAYCAIETKHSLTVTNV
jgi:hypothetical protein